MSRQQKRANERRLRKALSKISLAAGEGVGRAVAFSFALASNAFAAEPKKEEPIALPPVVVQDQNSPYIVPESSLSKFPVATPRYTAIDHHRAGKTDPRTGRHHFARCAAQCARHHCRSRRRRRSTG